MKNTHRRDKIFAGISWLIVFGMMFAAVQVVILPSNGAGPLSQAAGIMVMKTVYAIVYGGQGLLLAYAKVFKKKNLRKTVLMSIYLFMGFTTILSLGVTGFSFRLIDNLLLAVAAAACWLNWKFRTEYIDPTEFTKQIELLNDNH